MRWILAILWLLTALPAHAQDEADEAASETKTTTGTEAEAVIETKPPAEAETETGFESPPNAEASDSSKDAPAAEASDSEDTKVPGPPPKIAVVVAGDPDETLRNTAAFIEQEVLMAGLQVPSDPALCAALRGEPPNGEDGLEKLRSIRRSLGLDPRKDLASYQRIGLIAGADALVVIRREGLIRMEVFDVAAAQFYEGVLDFDTSDAEQRTKFIVSRADQAQLRWSAPPAPPPPADEKKVEVNPEEEKNDVSQAKRRWKKAWPYVLVGALLAGGVTYLIIDSRRAPESGVPLLRLTPGEE